MPPPPAASSSGHHVFRIRDYSLLEAITPNGKSIKSTSFAVGGHSWHVEYYPNGYDADHTDYVSVFLVLEDDIAAAGGAGEPVNVQLRFRFVDASSNPGRPWTPPPPPPPSELADMRGEKVRDFDGQGNGWGTVAFKKKEKLEREGLIVEDGLAIRCDIVVITQSCTATTTTEASLAAAAAASSSSEEMVSPTTIEDKVVNPVYTKWCLPPLFQ
uniref:MATH domain containing protein n=1 Tax=Oryza sativa subsp. japonica TaxID=39947 RepID=Q7XEL8_ORYSJ|nr:MATH domain containing protein [Oryza sativa Japonica Group]